MFSYLRSGQRRYTPPSHANEASLEVNASTWDHDENDTRGHEYSRHSSDNNETTADSSPPISKFPPVLPPIPRVASRHQSSSLGQAALNHETEVERSIGASSFTEDVEASLGRREVSPNSTSVKDSESPVTRRGDQLQKGLVALPRRPTEDIVDNFANGPTRKKTVGLRKRGDAIDESNSLSNSVWQSPPIQPISTGLSEGYRTASGGSSSSKGEDATSLPSPQEHASKARGKREVGMATRSHKPPSPPLQPPVQPPAQPPSQSQHSQPNANLYHDSISDDAFVSARDGRPDSRSYHIPNMRSGKARLTLKNPMSLLLKRRSTQAVSQLPDTAIHRTFNVPALHLPDGYDPSIRGKGVHDFSAPKSRTPSRGDHFPRSPDTGGAAASPSSGSDNAASRSSAGSRTHLNGQRANSGSSDRAQQPLVYRQRESHLSPGRDQRSTSQSSESPLEQPMPESLTAQAVRASLERDESSAPAVSESLSVGSGKEGKQVANDEDKAGSRLREPPLDIGSKEEETNETAFKPAGLKKRVASNASRFSFDLMGADSATQEKMLEEKHGKRESGKRRSSLGLLDDPSGDGDSIEDSMYDMDPDDMDNGIEEDIPGVNIDAEDEFQDTMASDNPLVSSDLSQTRTNDMEISAASGQIRPPDDLSAQDASPDVPFQYHVTPPVQGLGIETSPISHAHQKEPTPFSNYPQLSPYAASGNADPMDDLYYDDGLIESSERTTDQTVDESFLDDDKLSANMSPSSRYSTDTPARALNRENSNSSAFEENGSSSAQVAGLGQEQSLNAQMASLKAREDTIPKADVLTKSNLDAYHGALAAAANLAADKGEFQRKDTTSSKGSESETTSTSFSQTVPPLHILKGSKQPSMGPVEALGGSFDESQLSFDEDSDVYDSEDPMISAANAEALASDLDGFYGQEFGFYSQALGADGVEYGHGGYFGPNNGLGRSQSNRFVSQEPNLTPITERSEFSNRNSFILSPQLPPGQGPQSFQSPGLAQQMAGLTAPLDDSEMSMSSLMRLRRGAWGGSSASLGSGNSPSVSSSPLSTKPPVEVDEFSPEPSPPSSPTITIANLQPPQYAEES